MAKARDNTKEPLAGLYFAEVTIPNKKGLHARASAQFVRCASNFTAQVRVGERLYGLGVGRSKKEAEQQAAETAYTELSAAAAGGTSPNGDG